MFAKSSHKPYIFGTDEFLYTFGPEIFGYRLVNIRKSDKVPSLDCLEKNSNRIFSIWSMLEESNSAIFRREAETTLTGSPLPAVKWQTPLFDRLIETTESLALQSGAQRWDP